MSDDAPNDDTGQPKRYGVLIASSQFPDEPKLKDLACPENDVDGLSEVLNDMAIGGFSDVEVVKNQPSHQALRSVHKVLRKAGRDDLVLIYYAGHGKLDRAGRLHLATTETVNSELETTSIPAQRIRDLIDNADATKIALILDCCYSGAIEKSFLRGDVEEQLHAVAGGRGTFIMTASTDVQTAREEIRDGYGIFTKHVIDGMRGGADADGDGIVTMNELYDYVHRQVLADSHQVPMKWNLNVEGEMIIAQTGRKPREERRAAIRARLFALADEGVLPDVVFTRALEVSNLSFAETRGGAAAQYDGLLDQVLEEDLRVGDFLSAWLKVPPDDAPKPEAEPEPQAPPEPHAEAAPEPQQEPEAEPPTEPQKPEPAAAPKDEDLEPELPPNWPRAPVGWFWKFMVFPYEATQENLDRHPLYRLTHGRAVREREMARMAAGQKVGTSWGDVLIFVVWLVSVVPIAGGLGEFYRINDMSYFHSYDNVWRSDFESGAMTGTLAWSAAGWLLMKRASYRLNALVKILYWIAILGGLFATGVFISET